ncbi:MAG TPA: hypothetical protein VF610_11150, partial [Segetibacter sp.]
MKRIIAIVLTACVVCSNISGFSQFANLEFIENKGQWNDKVKFKGEMNNGAFFLQEKGFRVLLNNAKDIEQMSDFYHGVSHDTAENTASRLAHPPKDKT